MGKKYECSNKHKYGVKESEIGMIYWKHSVDHWPWSKKDLQVCALMASEWNKKEEEMKKGEEKEDTKGEEKKEEEKGVVKDNEARSHASHALLVKVILIFPPC